MPLYLLDTNILSDLVRNLQGRIATCIAQVGEKLVCTSMIAASELRFGAAKRNAPKLTAQVDAILAALEVRPFDIPTDREYAKLHFHLEQAGTPISPNDMLIAAHALAIESTLVTANTGEFSRVPGLAVENWLEAMPKR
ncbi:type II toxin-antitoxin system VapC family toxin [Thiobacillus sp.]|uniref:type II toxin-antitoxin system VapC family toxin n=1 Tax=Thiobacillus sp. TaxID=924 RepID=UPI0025F4A7DF|nr:type II toxin-antitoxin system VapC family toxin [Thiobacillus sp.]